MAGIRYAITGVGPMNFFGPQQPLQPQAQDRVEGRAFDYPVGYNLRIQPREGEPIGFSTLRGFADGYDLLRLVIETRKDQIEAFDFEIVPRNKEDGAKAMQGDIRRVTEFLESPDKEHDWPQWLRMQIEDLLVIDAVAVYPRMTRGGELYGLELVDAATLKRVIDDTGRTPLPPDVAYQQILKGIPAADYSRDQLVYTMRNPRTNRIYGYSPVEQIIMTVNIALRRQMSQLAFYTEGNVPEALAQVPATWTAKMIADFQIWWDSIMEGNQAAKRKMRFIPSLDNIVFPKAAVLKDEYDEWLARIVCFAFSISPSALIKQVNRASGEQMADTAKEEGLMPLLRFIESHMTQMIRKYLKVPGLRFQFKIVNRVDPKAQAEIHGTYIDKRVLTPDEVREDLDRDAMTAEQREKAFPPPVLPGMNPDGTPIASNEGAGKLGAAAGAKPSNAVAKPEVPAAATETPAEKMLAKALGMLDPERLAKALTDRVRAEPPHVIELRPEFNVEVGDTNVHVPVARAAASEPALSKRADTYQADMLALATTMAGRETVVNVAAPQVTVNTPEQTINVSTPDVHIDAPVTVNVPETKVEVPITVSVPETKVEVHQQAQGPTEETVERDHKGDIVRVVKKPI